MISKNHIKYIQSLHLKKNREADGLFIIEGIKIVTEFLKSNAFTVKEVFGLDSFINENQTLLVLHQTRFEVITVEELQKISAQQSPNQVLAVVEIKNFKLDAVALNQATSLYLDDIRDPGNLGTIIRIADWFGIKQVICSLNTTELYNPKTLQATMGALLRVSVIYMNFDDFTHHITNTPIYGAVLSGENIYQSTLKSGVIVIGNEANGISDAVLKKITYPITIPAAQNNGSESLNAANACAIICGEFYRQLNF